MTHQLEMTAITPRCLDHGAITLRLWPDGHADWTEDPPERSPRHSIEGDARWMLDGYERAAKAWEKRAAFVREWLEKWEAAHPVTETPTVGDVVDGLGLGRLA